MDIEGVEGRGQMPTSPPSIFSGLNRVISSDLTYENEIKIS